MENKSNRPRRKVSKVEVTVVLTPIYISEEKNDVRIKELSKKILNCLDSLARAGRKNENVDYSPRDSILTRPTIESRFRLK